MAVRKISPSKLGLFLAWRFVVALLAASMAPLDAWALPRGAQDPLELLHSSEREILLQWTTSGFEIERIDRAGQVCHRVLVPGTVQTTAPGAPQVPVRGTLLGLPPALSSLQDVAIQVVEADWETLGRYRLCPAPAWHVTSDDVSAPERTPLIVETFEADPERYARDTLYPEQPVEIGMTGYLRDQAVAQVQFNPLSYNPATGEVRLYRRVRARVTWATLPQAAAPKTRWTSPAYESLLRSTLINYQALRRPPPQPSPVGTGEGKEAPSPALQGPILGTRGGTNPLPPPRLPGGTEGGALSTTPRALKIGVTVDGLYQLTYGDLNSAGFDPSGLDPRQLKLRNQGIELPIYVTGEDDGTFDLDDVILFYGVAITDVYTTENVYWLTAGGANGQRMETRDGTPSASALVPDRFATTLHAEQDTTYWVTMPDGEGQDHWFWEDKLTAPESRDYTLTLHNLSTTASTATVRLRLKGHTDTGTQPDHHTRLYLNGLQIDDRQWDGFQVYDHQVTVPHTHLHEGSNTLRVESVGDTGAAVDQVWVNWIEVDYWDTYLAENDELSFGPPRAGTFQFEVAGYSGNSVDVFDVSDPADVARITNVALVVHGDGYQLRFEDTAQAETRYLALAPTQRKTPARLELDRPSNWSSTGNGADYILITHEDLYDSALRLTDHRRAQGLRVATVLVEDIYDEFNGGVFHPQAIRDFLAYAYGHWAAPAPAYVTLLGGASYDYRDRLDLGRAQYVPTQMIETETLGQTPSDNWLVLLNGDDVLPDMMIGRLTAQSPAEAEDVVAKILYYESHPPGDAWNTQVLLVADDEPTFESVSEDLAARLPYSYRSQRVYTSDYPPGDPRDDVIDAIQAGRLFVHYTGHGNVDRWGSWSGGPILRRSDVTALRNWNRLPLVSLADCLNGYFAGKNVSIAEEFLLRDDRGAVAVWAPSGMGYPSGHQVLMGAFYDALFQDDLYPLGASTTAAKIAAYAQSSYWADLVETYVLLGDPALQPGIPANYPYLESTDPANGASAMPVDREIQIRFSKPMNPATVALNVEGMAGLAFTPTWNADHTEVTYAHPGLGHGRTLTLTISGQDRLGNPLGAGRVPSTWSFTTLQRDVALEGVLLNGPAQGAVSTAYTFQASVRPTTATLPVTYTWQATGQAPQTRSGDLNDAVTYTWDEPGTVVITVTATNAAGVTVTGTHQVEVLPVSLDVAGPARGAIHTPYTFQASVRPLSAAQPVTYTWQATEQALQTRAGGLDDTVSYSWDTPGTKTIAVTAANAEGAFTDVHRIYVAIPPESVDLDGPSTSLIDVATTFTATVRPISATIPITYVWHTTGLPPGPLTRAGGLSDAVTLTWSTPGRHTLTVTAINAAGVVTRTHSVVVKDLSPAEFFVHLPLVNRP